MTERQFEEFWGRRCHAYHPGCSGCRAWQLRDLLAALVREFNASERTPGSLGLLIGEAQELLTADEPRVWVDEESGPWGTPEEDG